MGVKKRGGRFVTEVIPDVKKATLREVVGHNVEVGSTVSTDELAYWNATATSTAR